MDKGMRSRAPTGANDANDVQRLTDPERPRDNIVPSKERPQGHYATPRGRTPLQQHLDFFDVNKDGRIFPYETFFALYVLKPAWEPFNTFICFWLAIGFHMYFAYKSQDSWIPDPRLIIYTRKALRMKHGSDTGCYDHNGYFVPAKFEAIWERYDRTGKGRLSFWDVLALIQDKVDVRDIYGAVSTTIQWLLTFWIFHDEYWQLRKADVRGIYDGTAFYRMADRNGYPWYGMAARRNAVEKGMG